MRLEQQLNTRLRKEAKIISLVFTPFFVPFLILTVILFFTHLTLTLSERDIFIVLDLVFRFTIVLPLISIFFLHKINHLSFNNNVSPYDKIVGAFMVSTLCYLFIAIVLLELGFTIINSTILSFISVLLLFTLISYKWEKEAKVTGVIDEYDLMPLHTLNKRKEQFMPLILTLISYIFCAIMMFRKGLPWYLNAIIITSILILVIHILINTKWKISEHMTAMGAVTGSIIALANIFSYNPIQGISLSIILTSILASARLILEKNSLTELLFGYLIGFICALIALNNTLYHYISTIFTYNL